MQLISSIWYQEKEQNFELKTLSNLYFCSHILNLTASFEITKLQAADNSIAIKTLNDSNKIQKKENSTLKNEVKHLKKGINNIRQYLHVDDVEGVGLPLPDEENSEESNLLELFNSLNRESDRAFVSSDIDICHAIPSNRKDGKRVVVCKFSSRKHKIKILKAKKSSCDLKFKEN